MNQALTKTQDLLLALVLTAAWHAIPFWLFLRFPSARGLHESLGEQGYWMLRYTVAGMMPLLLCLGSPSRSGLVLGGWHGRVLKALGICTLPVALTAIIYPFTSRPFSGGPISSWLVSPAAQDLLFAGYLYGLFDISFPGVAHARLRINRAVFVTSFFFALWHVPNFWGMSASYVSFQLLYVFVGGAWILLARQITGSIIPGVLTHMAVNFIACL